MYLASSRQSFTSTVFSAPLQLTTGDGELITLAQLVQCCAGHQVDILGHGCRNNFDGALAVYRQMDQRLTAEGIEGIRIGYFWAGSWARLGFLAAVSRTKRAAEELKVLIDALNAAGCTVNLETHSLMARVALQALEMGAKVERLILTAPAVNNDVLRGEFYMGVYRARKVWVLWSKRDSVLKWPYRMASLFRTALGLSGPNGWRPEHVAAVDMSDQVAEHGGYKDAARTYSPEFWRG